MDNEQNAGPPSPPVACSPTIIATEIKQKRREIERLEQDINDIAKVHIPDFHFLDYAVSTFWTCADSPIGVCVFILDGYGRKQHCRYCGGPVERK